MMLLWEYVIMESALMKMRSLESLIDSGVQILHGLELVGELGLASQLHLKMRVYTMVSSKHGDALHMVHTS
jgi:hypothetical protein